MPPVEIKNLSEMPEKRHVHCPLNFVNAFGACVLMSRVCHFCGGWMRFERRKLGKRPAYLCMHLCTYVSMSKCNADPPWETWLLLLML